MSRRIVLSVCGLMLCLSAGAWSYFKAEGSGPKLTAAATAFVDSLDEEQKKTALLEYSDKQRVDWHFIPKDHRKGLQVKHMKGPQRKAAMNLLRAALSRSGLQKARGIMNLESLLQELEKGRQGGPIRDSERYYFTVFGEPSQDSQWGLSIEGHHLSLNFVVDRDAIISSTPSFFAANPGVVMNELAGVKKGTRLLKDEEQLAFELVNSLDEKQRKTAVIAEQAPKEIRAAGEPQPPSAPPEGLAAEQLAPPQRELLQQLLRAYAGSMTADVAEQRFRRIEEAGRDKIHFAWAGALEPGIGHYYRVQGPTFLVEFVNTQPDAAGNPANHIHCVWRDMAGDFALPIQ